MRRNSIFLLGLLLITFACLWPVGSLGFIVFDDFDYVCFNPAVRSGINWPSFLWSITDAHCGNWHPLTWWSHMLDCELFGVNASEQHWMNLGIHATNGLLLFLWLTESTGARWRSFFVAALFAVHPLRVESVAWIAERKDVLSGFFFMTVLWSYTRYCRHKDMKNYVLVLTMYALGLMAKPMLVTVPFVLLLIDVWPLARKPMIARSDSKKLSRQTGWRPLFVEKIPMFLLSLASCVVTLWAQKSGGAMDPMESSTLWGRCLHAMVSYSLYLGKIFYPVDLAVYYPLSLTNPDGLAVLGSFGLLAILFMLAIWRRHAQPYLLVGWAWFFVMLLPVIGVVQAGWQSMADRYTYLPSIGVLIAVVWGLADLTARRSAWRAGLAGFGAACVLACGLDTGYQLRFWRDSVTLFQHVVDVSPKNNVLGYYNLANSYGAINEMDSAAHCFNTVLEANPNFLPARIRLAHALVLQQKYAPAVEQYRLVLTQQPESVDGLNTLAWLLATCPDQAVRNGPQALVLAQHACQLTQYKNAASLSVLAAACAEAGQFDNAVENARKACEFAAAQGDAETLEMNQRLVALYQNHETYREVTNPP